jgi:hypothetical protein
MTEISHKHSNRMNVFLETAKTMSKHSGKEKQMIEVDLI